VIQGPHRKTGASNLTYVDFGVIFHSSSEGVPSHPHSVKSHLTSAVSFDL